jgi:hypothetical protein
VTSKPSSRRCSAIATATGKPCRAWAIAGSDTCAAHRTSPEPVEGRRHGAPAGNTNRKTHGFYARPSKALRSIDDLLEDMLEKQSQLSTYIEEQVTTGSSEVEEMAKLFALLGQNASRIGRLLRDQRALSGESADSLLNALGVALDEISTELGINL